MASKKQQRMAVSKSRKMKRGRKTLFLTLIVFGSVVFLIVFFITIFDIIFPTTAGKGVLARREKTAYILYFADANERFLIPEKRLLPKEKEVKDQADVLVKALIDGSRAGHVSTFPQKATLQGVSIGKDGLAKVSFGKDLVTHHPGGSTSEMTTIYSLTDTLMANIPGIKGVKILIDGKERDTLKGHLDISEPFTFNKEMIVPSSQSAG
jgi:spore germination protein GerM